MSSEPPISFAALAKQAKNSLSGGYPFSISGEDLDKNFVYLTTDYNSDHFKEGKIVGPGGHTKRTLKISAFEDIPKKGTFLLGAVNGTLQWIATEKC